MIEETIARIEQAIQRAADADPRHRRQLIDLLEQLKREVAALPSTQHENARSIAEYAEAAAREAARKDRSDETVQEARSGLEASVVGFETSHPELTAIVNKISNLLAGMGI